ncbi:MAG: hypothetical protein K0S39_1051 [Paenibacillus sp.]|nr:hypothetical protein [Paenibacillus sp.]
MKNDKLLIAGIIGALSTIPAEIVSRGLVLMGIGKNSIYSISSILIAINRTLPIMGLIISSVIGCFSAILLYRSLLRLGSDYIVIKSVMVSILLWIALEMFFTMFIEGKFIDIRPVNDYYNHLVGAIIFGITEGILFRKFLLFIKNINNV